jgi:hypothetical protein
VVLGFFSSVWLELAFPIPYLGVQVQDSNPTAATINTDLSLHRTACLKMTKWL